MLMDMSLPKCDIYQGTVATNCFKTQKILKSSVFFKKRFCLMSGLKFNLSGVTWFLLDNLSELKKVVVRSEAIT